MPNNVYRKPTDEDQRYIQTHYRSKSIAYLAGELALSVHIVTRLVDQLGLRRTKRKWTPDEEQFFRDHHGLLSYEAIAQHLGMSLHQVHGKRPRLGLAPIPNEWRPEHVQFLKEEGPFYTYSQIATRLGLTKAIVRRMCRILEIPRPYRVPLPYSEQEKQFVIDHYAIWSATAISKHLNRPLSGIVQLAGELGVRRTPEEVSQFKLTLNSVSDEYIAGHMAKGNSELQQKLLQCPLLLAVRRQELILNRIIKHVSTSTNG